MSFVISLEDEVPAYPGTEDPVILEDESYRVATKVKGGGEERMWREDMIEAKVSGSRGW